MSKFKVGDRVRYYGTYNEYSEVSTATVDSVKFDGRLIRVILDYRCDDDGNMIKDYCPQWCNSKQLRKLKPKVKVEKKAREWILYGDYASEGPTLDYGEKAIVREVLSGQVTVTREELTVTMRKEFPTTGLGPWWFNFLENLGLGKESK